MDTLDPRTKEVLLSAISQLVSTLSEEDRDSLFKEIKEGHSPGTGPLDGVPISVFGSKLAGLEALTQYLREVENRSYKDIAIALNRKPSTIYNTYAHLKQKHPPACDASDTSYLIPLGLFADRTYSILEHLVAHLKGEHHLSLTEIAALLNKGYSTIKTVHRRHKIKKNG